MLSKTASLLTFSLPPSVPMKHFFPVTDVKTTVLRFVEEWAMCELVCRFELTYLLLLFGCYLAMVAGELRLFSVSCSPAKRNEWLCNLYGSMSRRLDTCSKEKPRDGEIR